jgi:hypothetical protein
LFCKDLEAIEDVRFEFEIARQALNCFRVHDESVSLFKKGGKTISEAFQGKVV